MILFHDSLKEIITVKTAREAFIMHKALIMADKLSRNCMKIAKSREINEFFDTFMADFEGGNSSSIEFVDIFIINEIFLSI